MVDFTAHLICATSNMAWFIFLPESFASDRSFYLNVR
jgi:hypothetical protein